jgi:hypothetical protein
MQGEGHTPHRSLPAHPQSQLVTDLHLAPVLSTPHHALWYSPSVTCSPHTHTAQTHFTVRSSRTLSTQACSSQASLSLSAPHRQATPHSLLLTSLTFNCLHLTDRPCYTACSSQAHVHTAHYQTQPCLPPSFLCPPLSMRHQILWELREISTPSSSPPDSANRS